MLKLREILVSTDFSPDSMAAFEMARDLAEATGASIALMTVVEFPAQLSYLAAEVPGAMLDASFRDTVEHIVGESKKSLKELAKKLGARCKETIAVDGISASHEILRVASERKVDMIVIATHGRTGLARVALGSTAERVVREAACPVLTVKSKSAKKPE
jgi:nucleotide-binding universal stress UspA family protein